MRLVRFNGGRLGILEDTRVYDVTDIIGPSRSEWPPTAILRLINDFAAYRPKLAQAAVGPGQALESVRLEAPITWPNKILAYPINYKAHGEEMRSASRADINGFFTKATSSLSGPQDPIVLPDLPGREFHHEVELAIVIGKEARHIPVSRAPDYIFGYTCLLDITLRGKEERVMRKSYDTFCPIGPALVTSDEVGDTGNLELGLWVNGDQRQRGNTRDFILDVSRMVALAASVATLYPGDLIATGTPAGVGRIRPGDTVSVEIERVGRMSLSVTQGSGGHTQIIGT